MSSPSARALAALGAILIGGLALLLLGLSIAGGDFALGFGQGLGELASGRVSRIVTAAAGLALLAADALLVLRSSGVGSGKTIEFESGAGNMTIDVSALEECLKRTALEDPEVTEASATIRIPRGLGRAIICDMDIGIVERADIPGKGSDIAARIRRRFLQIVPLETDPLVNLKIKIRPSRPGPDTAPTSAMPVATPTPAAEKLPEVPEFTGERRYVVPEEGEGSV